MHRPALIVYQTPPVLDAANVRAVFLYPPHINPHGAAVFNKSEQPAGILHQTEIAFAGSDNFRHAYQRR